MSIITIPTGYYRQYDTDPALEVPAEGFGGWAKADLEFDLERSAILVMHAADCGTREQSPGRYRSVEYLPRSNRIAETVFPKLLGGVRKAGIRVFHLPFPGNYYQQLPGYRLAQEIAEQDQWEALGISSADNQSSTGTRRLASGSPESVRARLQRFKRDHVFPGKHNAEANAVSPAPRFYAQAEPLPDEPIVENDRDLFAVCQHFGIEHLVYIGFAIDGCLLTSPGGMLDMSRRGILCSAIREAVTAIETKETARTETAKEIALWRVAISFGFVYELDDFLQAISAVHSDSSYLIG
jgi:hypothetical protein